MKARNKKCKENEIETTVEKMIEEGRFDDARTLVEVMGLMKKINDKEMGTRDTLVLPFYHPSSSSDIFHQ